MSIHTLADLRSLGARVRVKFVDAAEPGDLGTPASISLHPPGPYIDTAAFGSVALRAIEGLEFPAVVSWSRGGGLPGREIVQDLDAVAARLAALGRFPVERTERGLRVTGYAR